MNLISFFIFIFISKDIKNPRGNFVVHEGEGFVVEDL